MSDGPKILFLDIETLPMEVYTWGLFDQNIPLEMVKVHTTMFSWAAKWAGKAKIYYQDVTKEKNIRNDKKITENLKKLIDQSDIVIGHNLDSFDKKKTNYRIIVNNLKPTDYRVIDTLKIARKHFKFDSNKLAHIAEILDVKFKKLKHKEFPGNKLWVECMAGNKKAWAEMKRYNFEDVLVFEEFYKKLIPWDKSLNFNTYNDNNENKCSCGSFVLKKWGYRRTNAGKYQRYMCDTCGKYHYGKHNLLTSLKRSDMHK
jgi:hypothetical protein